MEDSEDTMFLAFGDHGQTYTGGHAGVGDDETSSIMFFNQQEPFMKP